MLYTIIDIYEVLRTDSIYEPEVNNYLDVDTDPSQYLK